MRELTEASFDRFIADYRSALGTQDDGSPVGIAVSGGGDSLALLRLAVRAFSGRLAAATVDHGMRPESAQEAQAVADICATLGVPHAVLSPTVPIAAPGNLQQKARQARYRALSDWAVERSLTRILTAHSRDDVAETFLMRAARGAGVSGLARMAAETAMPYAAESGVRLVRPLLDWSRAELRALAESTGWPIADDPSNTNPKYDRARIRRLLANAPDLPSDRLAQAARNLNEAEAALQWLADEAWLTRATVDGTTIRIDAAELPRETRRRLAARAIRQLRNGEDWPGEGLDGLIDHLDSGRAATLAGILARPGPPWRFAPAPPRHGQS
ncbi:tRNA lysidine(34) synthetase TilS [Flavisphingomonas formosensis]|uniref:tRNA lysidine(34) synthetase TilS n=1 Tax=Flavisphingomonas formosensis TaxID=861534 RepID=UPI001E4D51AB|nr:tRNA lysidine(34) synthetase TilS [Sphingomonas formosensis]